MPTEPNVVKRLLRLGFVAKGARGISTTYRSNDGTIHVDLAGKAQHFALSPEHAPRVHEGTELGSVYVHRAKDTEPPELRRESVLIANGPYQRFLITVVPPSGRGSAGNSTAWRDTALEALLVELERRWLTPPEAPTTPSV